MIRNEGSRGACVFGGDCARSSTCEMGASEGFVSREVGESGGGTDEAGEELMVAVDKEGKSSEEVSGR